MDNYGLVYIHENGLCTYGKVVMAKEEAEEMALEVMATIHKYCNSGSNPIVDIRPTPLAL